MKPLLPDARLGPLLAAPAMVAAAAPPSGWSDHAAPTRSQGTLFRGVPHDSVCHLPAAGLIAP